MENMEIYLPDYSVNIECCKLFFTSYYTDNKLVFANIRSVYKQDKRTTTGYGNKLESVKIELVDNIPVDWYLLDLKQYMEYQEQKEDLIFYMKKQKEVIAQFKENKIAMEKYIKNMEIESYDKTTQYEIMKYSEWIEELKL